GAQWQTDQVEGTLVNGGGYDGLVFDVNGHPHISYCLLTREGPSDVEFRCRRLKYAYHDGTSWHIETVENGGTGILMGEYNAIALDPSGRPHISYYDAQHNQLKHAVRADSGWEIQVVENTNSATAQTSIGVDSNGVVHIIYCDCSTGDIKYARSTGGGWQVDRLNLTDASDVAMALDKNGRPHISYCVCPITSQRTLYYGYYDGLTWHEELVDSSN